MKEERNMWDEYRKEIEQLGGKIETEEIDR